ncbi:Putative gustatory receptor 28b [Cyphomyrmex costatus]|uniref:Gustatory receptor n=1 Tax=Cyphomyrmex costatus TaxID=456900 RepID=A0A151K2L9_9HYME|nr:Putative gustatory receptor 28b [Cyphomyrmex costatus]
MWKKWQLFHATDFQSLMYPNFVFCRILGLFPYKINALTFETSRQHHILSTLFICVVCIIDLICLHKIIISGTVTFGSVIRTLEIISFFTTGGFITIVTYILNSPRLRLLRAMLENSSYLPPKSYQKLCRWIHTKDILGTSFLIIHAGMYYYKIKCGYSIVCVLSTYMSLVVFHMDMQYMNCVYILKDCFKRINDNLVHMQRIMVNNIKLCVPSLIYHMQRSQFLLIELRILKKQHLSLCNTVKMLNIIFSPQLLATLALTFTKITFELYKHLINWQDGLSFILDDEISDVYFLMSIGYVVLKIILIVWICETNKNQAVEISTTIHDVLNCTSNEQIKEELYLFSLQIMHCKNILSTKGLSINATFLAAMIGSVTTYILILAQFMIMAHSYDGNTESNIQMT